MKPNTLLAGTIAVVFVCLSAYAQAQDLKLAPLNPEFVNMANNSRRGLQGPVLRTPDGHGLGLLPSPMDFSHLVGRESDARFLRAVTNSSYDLRSLGRVTDVKNQGDYGTCWSFASYGSLESCLLYSGGGSNDFSENNMVNLDGFDLGFDGGGNALMATAYLARWLGPVNDSDDPYPNPGGSPVGLPLVKHVQSVEVIGKRQSSVANDEIKQAVMDRGPVYVSMCWDSTSYNSANSAYFKAYPAASDHAVAIVGWDDSFSRTRFSSPQPSGDGAFIVKNSWGTSWGSNGYFYVSYYDTVFARSSSYLFLNGEATNLYNQVYQYDPFGWVTSFGYSSAIAWGANVFTVTNSGELNAISFYAGSSNASYEIFIYSGVSASQPRSGSLRADQSGSLTNAGYYTITLSSPIALSSGEAFSIVVKFTTLSYNYPIPVEYALAGYSSQATASPGESFVSSDGSSWLDTTDYDSTMNVCIKAFLRPTTYPYSPPGSFSATDGTYSNKVHLSWLHASGVSYYAIYRSTASSVLSASLLATTVALFYDDAAVTPGVVYYYWAKTVGESGSSDYSTMDYGCAKLLAPSGLSASQGTSADKVQLSWNAVSGAEGYIILRNQANNGNTASEIFRSSALSYDDTAASPGSYYYYWVKAYSFASTSSLSSAATGYRAIGTPGGVSASAGTYSSGILVSWAGVSGAESYVIWRAASANSSAAVNIGETAYTSFADTSASAGTVYYYWIQAKKWSFTGSLSDYASGWRRSMAAGNNARGDIDGDGIMDFAVYQAANGTWYARLSGSGYETVSYQLGASGYRAVACDYDGDGHTDPTVYQSATGQWIALLSGSGYASVSTTLGGAGLTPVTGDYDGDGRADLVVYQEAAGLWHACLSRQGYALITFAYGGPGYRAVAADYDADGLVDPAVYCEQQGGNLGDNIGLWYMALSGSGYASSCKTTSGVGYIPVPADYDGDGKADMAIYHPTSGVWNYWSSASNYPLPVSFTLGGTSYTAVPGDYDGDSKADIAVYREADGKWYFLLSSRNYASEYGDLGGPGYEPVGAVK